MSALKNQEQRLALAKLKGNNDTSIPTLLLEYTREFAWGPSAPGPIQGALTARQIQPMAICRGAAPRERSIRFQEGALVIDDWDHSTEGPASYEFVNDHAFTVNDGGQNFGCCPSRPTDTFSFRIDGDMLVITMIGQDDPWGGTTLEEASWHRVNRARRTSGSPSAVRSPSFPAIGLAKAICSGTPAPRWPRPFGSAEQGSTSDRPLPKTKSWKNASFACATQHVPHRPPHAVGLERAGKPPSPPVAVSW